MDPRKSLTIREAIEQRGIFERELFCMDTAAAAKSWEEHTPVRVVTPPDHTAATTPEKGYGAGRDYQIIQNQDLTPSTALGRLAYSLKQDMKSLLHFLPMDHAHTSACAKRYENGGHQGWHKDGNDITALLYLNTPQEGGGTIYLNRDGHYCRIHPEAGKLIVFEGRQIWHAAEPTPDVKLALILNLYRHGTFETRPQGLDQVILGM